MARKRVILSASRRIKRPRIIGVLEKRREIVIERIILNRVRISIWVWYIVE